MGQTKISVLFYFFFKKRSHHVAVCSSVRYLQRTKNVITVCIRSGSQSCGWSRYCISGLFRPKFCRIGRSWVIASILLSWWFHCAVIFSDLLPHHPCRHLHWKFALELERSLWKPCEKHAHNRTPMYRSTWHSLSAVPRVGTHALLGTWKKPRKWTERERAAREQNTHTQKKKGQSGRKGSAVQEKQFVKLVHMHTEPTVPICPHHQLSAGDIHQDKEVSDAPNVLCGWHYKI